MIIFHRVTILRDSSFHRFHISVYRIVIFDIPWEGLDKSSFFLKIWPERPPAINSGRKNLCPIKLGMGKT